MNVFIHSIWYYFTYIYTTNSQTYAIQLQKVLLIKNNKTVHWRRMSFKKHWIWDFFNITIINIILKINIIIYTFFSFWFKKWLMNPENISYLKFDCYNYAYVSYNFIYICKLIIIINNPNSTFYTIFNFIFFSKLLRLW